MSRRQIDGVTPDAGVDHEQADILPYRTARFVNGVMAAPASCPS